jgi:ribonuclease HI
LDKKHGRIGYFLIIRDFEEIVLVARSTTRNFLVTPEVAEVLTALYNVETCKEMGFYDIILGGDALYIVQAIKAIRNNWSN